MEGTQFCREREGNMRVRICNFPNERRLYARKRRTWSTEIERE